VSRAVLDYGFVRMGLHKVAEETVAANVPARLLLERLGFRQEGLLREHARLAGEWVDIVWYGLLADRHKPAIGLSTT
jgi:RimJ/RimL family protein N-acetyltransferase